MKRRWVIAMLVGVVVIAMIGAVVWAPEREPQYKGRKLSEWLDQADEFPHGAEAVVKSREAADAVRHIGRRALPWLVNWTTAKPPDWRMKLAFAMDHVTYRFGHQPFSDTPRGQRLTESDWALRVDRGVTGFGILGADARPAIPELSRIINSGRSARVACDAMMALRHIGLEGLAPLLVAVTNSALPAEIRECANEQLGLALPSLRQALKDPNRSVREQATNVLRRFAPVFVEGEHTGR